MGLSRNHFKMVAYLIISAIILFVCTFEPLSGSTNSHSSNTFCGSACQPHTQAERIIKSSGFVIDEKEPTPPFITWITAPQSLFLLYTSSLFVLIYFFWNKKLFIRHSNLRF